jgi:proteic killer suppression protein
MEVEFSDDDLDHLETDAEYTAGLSPALVKAFRKRMQQIRAAADERDFYALRGLRFEKLAGARKHQHSMRLNDQYRLIVELLDKGRKALRVVEITDYH